MPLAEVHLPRRAFGCPPQLDPPLQGPDLPVRKPAWGFALQPCEYRLGLQPRALIDLLADPLPDITEGILAGAPMSLPFQLAGQPILLQILPSRFRVHPRLRGRNLLIPLDVRQLPQPPHLVVRDHLLALAERNL